MRELSWPYRSIGSQDDPRIADAHGNFTVANLFAGPIRISASSPIQQESRGEWQGEIRHEGDNQTAVIRIGAAGSGSVSVLVDWNDNFARVPNAEVALLAAGSGFDFTTTDQNGATAFTRSSDRGRETPRSRLS